MKGVKFHWYCLLTILSFLGCKQRQETISPEVADITESVYASGRVKSKNQYFVYATVTSTLDAVLVEEGTTVRAGQPIAILKNNVARLTGENARLSSRFAEINQNKDKLEELRVSVQLAKNKLANDSLLMVRQNNLRKQNIGSEVEWEQRRLGYESSLTAYQSALLRYRELQRQLNLSSEQARIGYEIAVAQLGDFTVKSKIDGKLYAWLKEQGELVNPQTALAVIGDANDFLLELDIDETDVGRVAVGQSIVASLSGFLDTVWQGRVDRIIPMMNDRSKLFTLEAQFSTRPTLLYPNLTAEANIIVQTKQKALLIPRVYLVNDSTVMLKSGPRKVKCGLRDYQKVEILQGITAADVLVKPSP